MVVSKLKKYFRSIFIAHMSRKAVLVLLSSLFVSYACSEMSPESVYVPGPDAKVSFKIYSDKKIAKVNEKIVLSAERKSSGFVRAKVGSLDRKTCRWGRKPKSSEKQVSGNVTWLVEPNGYAHFNTESRRDRARDVYFVKPGSYSLSAISAFMCLKSVKSSNEIELTIIE